ncbi:hypothetical protein K439DRAFT_1639928 [Ramaria rubella]|nr:hypothetical protein K439DRAFT_1639928 [Ramaria rubella]
MNNYSTEYKSQRKDNIECILAAHLRRIVFLLSTLLNITYGITYTSSSGNVSDSEVQMYKCDMNSHRGHRIVALGVRLRQGWQ